MLEIWRLSTDYGTRQTIWLAVCLAALWGLTTRPAILDLFRRYKYLWLAGGLGLTALTFVIGTYPGGVGPHLWLGFFGIYLQPSEPLKLLLLVYLAAYTADLRLQRLGFVQWLMPTLIILAASLLILLAQRDLGTATIFILIFTFIVFQVTGKRRILLISGLTITAAGFLGYQLFDVIRVRVDAWLNPWLDPSGRSYQIVQSIIAVASGGVFGRGAGLGSPGIIPVAQSDFIFSAIAEETGLVGIIGLLVLIALLFSRGINSALQASDSYRRNLAAGVSVYLAIQSIFIIGGNLRLLPLSGVTLPFVSYGGSSLLTGFIALWMLMTISDQSKNRTMSSVKVEPYILSSTLILAGLVAASIVTGWWAVVRSMELNNRVDNPRRSIAERYVQRGSLVDRTGQPITQSTGSSGNFVREYKMPELAATTGYSHPVYGLSGLEMAYDGYLRGTQGNPSMLIWSNQILYGQPPPGLDIRLSINLETQKLVNEALDGKQGAIILMNAETGEILAIGSQPGFDPNTLEENWLTWSTQDDSPMVNRVTQGQYPVGSAIGPFILAYQPNNVPLNNNPSTTRLNDWDCSLIVDMEPDWNQSLMSGCPGVINEVLNRLPENRLIDIYQSAGFFSQPEIALAQAPTIQTHVLERKTAIIGSNDAAVTPLQMVLAAASISAGGSRPSPRIAMAVNTPAQGWVILPTGRETQSYSAEGISMVMEHFGDGDISVWNATASVPTGNGLVHWFIGGTNHEWQGTPMAIAVVIEEGTAKEAADLGKSLLRSVMLH